MGPSRGRDQICSHENPGRPDSPPSSRFPGNEAVCQRCQTLPHALKMFPKLCDNLTGVTSGLEATCQTFHI